jgi:DnaJ family protein A protein 2
MCSTCDGQGIVVELRQIALGMVQQLQRRCQECEGEGYRVKRKKERKVLEVLVEKGMKHNQKIVFRGMADEKPNMEAGNINFVIQEKEHELFKRKGADLLITKTLSLNEALCGFEWKITHLDNREIVIQSKPGEVIKAEADHARPFVKIVPGEGMPSHGNPFVKGDLYVLFRVEFPEDGSLQPDQVAALKKILPGAAMAVDYDPETAEVVHLEHADVKNFGKGGATKSESAYDSDDEEGGPQAVQCQQS